MRGRVGEDAFLLSIKMIINAANSPTTVLSENSIREAGGVNTLASFQFTFRKYTR
jgi:hypothetical protein